MTLQGMFTIRGLLEAGHEEYVGGIGCFGFAILEEITGVLEDFSPGRVVVREETGRLNREVKGRITSVALGADGLFDMSFEP